MERFDFTVVGGGVIGAATAVGLAKQGWRVAIVEHNQPTPYSPQQAIDLRVSAISKGSANLLKRLGAWDSLAQMRFCPYKRLATWELAGGRVEFDANELQLDALGYIVENRLIQLALWRDFTDYDNLVLLCPDRVTNIVQQDKGYSLTLKSSQVIESQTVIGADGAHSYVRQKANIGITAWDYRQHCMLIRVETTQSSQDITWQWFTPTGPRSFLPLGDQQACLVWYDAPHKIRELSNLTPEQLASQIEKSFPSCLGKINVMESGYFPLVRQHAQRYYHQQMVLLGDAAHTINPLAGQGMNLGFKDVKVLLSAVQRYGNNSKALQCYQSERYQDNLMMQTAMDAFYTGFSNNITPFKLLRNLSLKAVNCSGGLKKQLLKYAIGVKW